MFAIPGLPHPPASQKNREEFDPIAAKKFMINTTPNINMKTSNNKINTSHYFYKIPFVVGKLLLLMSLFTAIFIAFANALNIDSILWCSFSPSALIFKLHLAASLKDLKK